MDSIRNYIATSKIAFTQKVISHMLHVFEVEISSVARSKLLWLVCCGLLLCKLKDAIAVSEAEYVATLGLAAVSSKQSIESPAQLAMMKAFSFHFSLASDCKLVSHKQNGKWNYNHTVFSTTAAHDPSLIPRISPHTTMMKSKEGESLVPLSHVIPQNKHHGYINR